MVRVGIVALGRKYQDSSEFRVAVQGPDALYNVAVEHLEALASDDNLPPNKPGSARGELLVDDRI